jgi:TPR repeat protein
MTEYWPQFRDVPPKLDKAGENGRFRHGYADAPYREPAPRPPQSGPQNRSIVEYRDNLGRELEAIALPPGERRPYPQPQRPYPQPQRPYPQAQRPDLRQQRPDQENEHLGWLYRLEVLRFDGAPPARQLPPKLVHARRSHEWRYYALASLFGAVTGITGYAFLFHGEADTALTLEALTPAIVVAKSERQPGLASADAKLDQASDKPADVYDLGAQADRPAPPLERPAYQLYPGSDAPGRTAVPAVIQPSDEALLKRASDQLNQGDISGARSVYEAIANRGNSRGAFSLAETYDPNFFERHKIRGLKPDPNLARFWYDRAAKLGSLEASKRLKELTKTKPPASEAIRPSGTPAKTKSSGSEVIRG